MKARRMTGQKSTPISTRRGTMLVFAMIALLVTTMIGASLMRTTVVSMRQIQREQQQVQAHWLAEAGCQRALAKIHSDKQYVGETWDVPAEQLQSSAGATVRITIDGEIAESTARTVIAIAEYPKASAQPVRVTKRLTISVAAATKSD